jgi:GNAT superfamily N-acetyltransferase
MLEIKRLDLFALPEEERLLFHEMSNPYSIPNDVIPHIFLGAYWSDTPVGVVIASYVPIVKKGEIEHIFVAPEHRRRGIGLSLLEELEKLLRNELKCSVLLLTYAGDNPDRIPLEHVLRLNRWRSPTLLLKRYYYIVYDFSAPWFEKQRALPVGFSLHSWSELTGTERHRMQVQAAQGAYPYAVYPFGKGGEPESVNSIFIRHQGVVIGWLATHRLDADTIIYSGLYVHLDYRGKGLSTFLLVEGIRRQKASPVPFAMFELNEAQVSDMWQRFVAGGLAPHAIKQTDVFNTWKELHEKSEE